MRRIFVCFSILMILFVISHGQENRGPLPVSSSLISVKITDPDSQITKLMPIVQLVDKITAANPKAPKGVSISKSLAFLSGMLKGVPGIKSDGTFWILVMPPQFSQKNPEGLSTAVDDNGTPTFLVFPLSDPDVFQKFLDSETTKANKDMPRGMVYGDYALLGFEGIVPGFSQVDFDLQPISRRDMVVMLQWQNYELANNALKSLDIPFPAGMFPGAQPNIKVGDFLKKYETSILRMEFGINMVNNVLDVEMLNLPIAGSPLEEDLVTKYNTPTAKQLLRYMPATVFYAAAGGPLVESSPGTGYQLNNIAIDFMKKSFSGTTGGSMTKSYETVIQAYEEISRRCVNGRAIAWVPCLVQKTDVLANTPTFVAVYSTSPINKDLKDESRALVRKLFDSLFPTKKDANNKTIYNLNNREKREDIGMITSVTWPDQEKYGTTTVDVVKVGASRLADNDFKNKVIGVNVETVALEFRFAYIRDKLLITIGGPDSKVQMANLISRVSGKLAGLTSSPRFTAQAQNMSKDVRAIEVMAPRDLFRTVNNFFESTFSSNKKAKSMNGLSSKNSFNNASTKSFQQLLTSYPALTSYIVDTQEANDGCERFVYRVPLEQLRFMVALINPPPVTKKPVAKPKAPVKKTTRRR